jgi:hypothetical protein
MQIAAPTLNIRRRDRQSARPVFSVVDIHDGFESGIRAQEALEWLTFTLGFDLNVCKSSWSFNSLERLDVRSMSMRRAAAADVVIIAGSEDKPLPDHVRLWLDSSLQQQHAGRAVLVALHDEIQTSPYHSCPLCSCLESLADRWKTEFISQHEFDQRLDLDFALECISRKRPAVPQFAHSPERYPSGNAYRWGINE